MSSSSKVVLWRYTGSPFARKIEILLAMKGIPHSRVDIPNKPPRPQLADTFGIGYRRVPVLAIGNDVYCDTYLIGDALEQAFPASQGYTTLYPKGKNGTDPDPVLIKTFFHYWADVNLFPHGAGLVPWEKVTDIQADRLGMFGRSLESMIAARPKLVSSLQSHLLYLEEQLQDGREWMVKTVDAGIADASVFIFVEWVTGFKEVRQAFSFEKDFPKSHAWFNRFKRLLEEKENSGKAEYRTISAEESAKIIKNNSTSFNGKVDEADAKRWGLDRANKVAVLPTDEAIPTPTIGELVHLDFKETVLKTSGNAGVPVRVHFPRINYRLNDATKLNKSKL